MEVVLWKVSMYFIFCTSAYVNLIPDHPEDSICLLGVVMGSLIGIY